MCWMGNHFHIVLYAPGNEELPDYEQIAARHNAYYKSDKTKWIDADDEKACLDSVNSNFSSLNQSLFPSKNMKYSLLSQSKS